MNLHTNNAEGRGLHVQNTRMPRLSSIIHEQASAIEPITYKSRA